MQTNDPGVFQEADRLIREKKCDVVIQHRTVPALGTGATAEDGLQSLETNPEMGSLNMGLGYAVFKGQGNIISWTRSFHEKAAKRPREFWRQILIL